MDELIGTPLPIGPFCEFPVSILEPWAIELFMYRIENKFLWYLNMKNTGDGKGGAK